MKQKPSISSARISTTSYNYVSSLHPNKLKLIKMDAIKLMQAPERLNEIWKSIRKTDLVTNGSPNLSIFQSIFDENKGIINEIFKIQSAADFYEVFDKNLDGELNDDEQILIFSVLKEKMQNCANELVLIKEYDLFKQMMEKIRKFELTITNYQNELRQMFYKKQLETYNEIGDDKLEIFYSKYDNIFSEFDKNRSLKISNLKNQQKEEIIKLTEKNNKPSEMIKVKPNNKINEYQTQEKLLSIVERVAEAYNYRQELKILEVKEKENVLKKQENKQNIAIKLLELKHKKESEILEEKLKESENRLILTLRKEFAILQKKIHLHEREIKRIQSLVSKYAWTRGITLGQLKREKITYKQQNDILANSKKVKEKIQIAELINNPIRKESIEPPMSSSIEKKSRKLSMLKSALKFNWLFKTNIRQENINSLKKITESKNIVNFYLRNRFGSDKPINISLDNEEQMIAEKLQKQDQIEKFLTEKKKDKKDIIPNLTYLFDSNLKEKTDKGINNVKSLTSYEKKRIQKKIDIYLKEN